jgi:HEAT repeat protein
MTDGVRYVALITLIAGPLLVGAEAPNAEPVAAQAWHVLDESLKDGNSDHVQQALASMATLEESDPEAVQRAQKALHDKDLFVRRSAAIALGELQAKSSIPELKAALDDDSLEVSFAAAKALTQLGDTAGRDVLIQVLEGERKDAPGLMTNAMRDAKQKLRHPEGLFLMGAEDATGAMFGPVSMVFPAIKDTADLKSKGAPGRAAAVAYLAKYPDEYAVQLLEWALKDDNQFVCLEAEKALGERGNAGSIEKLRPLLHDKQNIVRDMAAASVLRILARSGEAGQVSPGPVIQPKTDRKQ